jgi:carbamoylphosphate synthase small subunit
MYVEVMDQKSIILYLNRNGWMTKVMHDDLVATLGEEATASSTATKYHREARTGPDDETILFGEISPHIDDSDEALLSALEDRPFLSVP